MRKVTTIVALAALASQMAGPAFARNLIDLAGPQGWRRQGEGAAMAYVRLPLRAPSTSDAQPSAGFKLVGPRSYEVGEFGRHFDNPTLVEFGFTGKNFTSPWTAKLQFGGTTTWASNPSALSPTTRHFLDDLNGSGLTWGIVIAASVGIGLGTFALINK